jgi:hypothetical protein
MISLYYIDNSGIHNNFTSEVYATICSKRIKIYLSNKISEDYSFEQALTLFAVAITDETIFTENKTNDLSKSNILIAEYLNQIANESKLHPALNQDIKLMLSKQGDIEGKIKNILEKLEKEPTTTNNAKRYDEVREDKKVNTSKLLGSSLMVGISLIASTSFLGPAGLIFSLPFAYVSLHLGDKVTEQAKKLLEQNVNNRRNYGRDKAIAKADNELLNNHLKNDPVKAFIDSQGQDGSLNSKNMRPLDNVEGIENIISTLNKSQAKTLKEKQYVNNVKSQQSQTLRKR